MVFGFLVAALIGPFQADQARERGRVAILQPKRSVCGKVAPVFPGMVVVGPREFERAEDAVDADAEAAFVILSWFGLIAGVDAIGCGLQETSDQIIGRFEDGRADQHFQLLHRDAGRLSRLEARDQLLDFLLLREEECRAEVFFLEPAAMAARVSPDLQLSVLLSQVRKALVADYGFLHGRHLIGRNVTRDVFPVFPRL